MKNAKMYIKGVGMTKFGMQNDTSHEMAFHAITDALEDAQANIKNVDAMVISNTDTIVNAEKQRQLNALMASMLKTDIPIIRVPAVCGGGGAALWTALNLHYDNILVVGTDKVAANNSSIITDQILEAADRQWEQDEGMVFPAQNALVAQQHMLKYGTTTDDLALIAYKNHQNAKINPKARFYKKDITLEQIKKSPIVASPLRLFDCSVSVNGAAALFLTKDKTDIEIAGSGLAEDYLATFERNDVTTWDATKIAAKKAYEQANITANDIDIVEIHDAFTIVELLAYEDLGFCKKGEGKNMIRDGIVNRDGKLPVNTSGGLKARGHPISPTGIAQIVELTEQLQGKAKEHQVEKKLKYGLAQNIGGAGSTIAVHILKKTGVV